MPAAADNDDEDEDERHNTHRKQPERDPTPTNDLTAASHRPITLADRAIPRVQSMP